jgi:hypothetical protein
MRLESRYVSKQNDSDEGVGTEHHRQTQIAAAATHAFNRSFDAYARLPFTSTTLWTSGGEEDERMTHSGLGDAEVMGRYTLPWQPANSRIALALGAKLPTGNNNLESDGERLTEHAQLGSGSYDGYAILGWRTNGWLSWEGSAGYRYNGVNSHDQRYGRTAWIETTVARDLNSTFRFESGLRLRDAARDQSVEGFDENSGGSQLLAMVEGRATLGSRVAVVLNGLIPVVSNLFGSQVEQPTIRAGLAVTL